MPVLPMTVLVTGAGALLGQGIIKSLRASSLAPRVIAADPMPLSAGLFWADGAYVIEMANSPDYLSRLGQVLEQAKPDILIPGTDIELPILAAHREWITEQYGTQVLVSDPGVIAIADDKYLTFEFLRDAGLAPPASALPDQAGALDALIDEVGFPLIVKPRIGARSVGVSMVTSAAELHDVVADRDGLVVQECVAGDGDEYTASAIVFDGQPRATIVMRRDLRDGNTYRAFPGPYPELNQQVRVLGAALKPFGPANFQFRLDRKGLARVFEINGRFSGTTPLRALVGFNEVEMCLRHILLGEEIAQPEIQEATILRYWSEILVDAPAIAALR